MESDTQYFRRRASDERSTALQARDARVRKAHLEMASRYEDLVRAIGAHEQRLGIHHRATSRQDGEEGNW